MTDTPGGTRPPTGHRRHIGGSTDPSLAPGAVKPPRQSPPAAGQDRNGARNATDAPPESGAPPGAPTGAPATPGAAGGIGGRLVRATLGMAAGTTVSRVTGLLRFVALAYALGPTHLADAYNLANTTPNMIYTIVLGGVLSATFIPIFVDRLATRSEREAWRAISSVITISVVVVVAMTVVFWLLAPEIISAYTVFAHTAGAHLSPERLAAEKSVATSLLRWFVPQVALYSLIALATALLNTRRRFAAPAWVPIANNVVVIAVLLWFHHLVPRFPSLAGVQTHNSDLVILGLGTTAGVAIQALALLPALRSAGIGRLRWRWDPRNEAVRTVLRLGSWTFGIVMANQICLYVVQALAVGTSGPDPYSSYSYAYAFMVLPYAIFAVSVMSAVTPELSERWTVGDVDAFRRYLTSGLRAILAGILPAAAGMLILARPAAAMLFAHGATRAAETHTTGAALALFAVGLPGYSAYLYVIRALQSMQRTKVAFYLYVVENGLNVVLALLLVHPMGVRGLALALSIAYTVSAVVGLGVLRRWLGTLGGFRTWSPLRRVAISSAVMSAVVVVISNVSGAESGVGLYARVLVSVVVGSVVYVGTAVLLGGRRRPLAVLGVTGPDTGYPASFGLQDAAEASVGTVAWGDTRIPFSPGPRVRIVPATDRRAPSLPTEGTRPLRPPSPPPARPRRRAGPSTDTPVTRPAPSPARPAARPARPPSPARRPSHPPAPVPPLPAESADNDDDPGDRRWIGGTPPERRRRPPPR